MASAFTGLREGIDTLIGLRKYELDQERLEADRAAQKEERDLRNQQIRLQTAGLQRQEDKAKTYDANQQSYQGLRQGMALAGYDDTLKNKVLENQANIMGDAESADKFSAARALFQKEGVIDTLRLINAGKYDEAAQKYSSVGDDKVDKFVPDPKDPDMLTFTAPGGKTGSLKISQIEAMISDPMDAAKRVADNADMVAKTNEEIRKWNETEGTRNPKQFVGSGGLFFDTVAGQYVPMPEWAQGLRFKSGKGSSTAGGGLSDAEGGLAKDYPITIHTPKGSFKKAFTNSDMRQTYEKIYKFPDESLRFQSPVEYDRLMRIATDNAPTYEKWLGKTIAEGLNLPEEPQKPSNYPWQQGIAPSQGKAAGLQKPQAVQGKPQTAQPPVPVRPSVSPSTLGLKTREQIAAEKAANTPQARQSLINQQIATSQAGRVAEQKAMQDKFSITGKDPGAAYAAIATGSTRANNDIKAGIIPDLKDLAAAYKLAEIQGDTAAMQRYEQVVQENRKYYDK